MNVDAATNAGSNLPDVFYPDADAQSPGFCAAYTDCYENGSCDQLTMHVRGLITTTEQCRAVPESAADFMSQSISISDGNFTAAGIKNIFSQASASVQEQSSYLACQQAIETGLNEMTSICGKTEITQNPQPPGSNDGFFGSIFKFIGEKWQTMLWALGSATLGVLALLRIIKMWKVVGREMEEAGKAVNALRKGLISLHRAFVDLGSTIKGFFKKKTAKETKPAETGADNHTSEIRRKMRATNPFLKPAAIGIDSLVGEPKLSVVLSQLEGLKDDKDNVILAKRLSALDKNGLLYLAYEVISGWYELVSKNEDSQKMARDFIQNSLPLYGGLPSAFVKSVVTDFFAQKKDVEIRAAAGEWARETARKIAAEIHPTPAEVERQLWTDTSFSGDFELVKYLVNAAIDEWSNYDIDRKADFIIDLTRSTNKGELPFQLLRAVKKVRLGEAKRLAPIYAQVVSHRQELADPLYFRIARAKAEKLLGAYEWLPKPLQKALGGRDSNDHLSDLFMELAAPLLNFGINERMQLSPAEEPWRYDPKNEEITPEGINISRIKNMIAGENPEFVNYPGLLDVRAKTIVAAWLSLPENVRAAFMAQDKTNGAVNHGGINLSVTYIKFWLKLNGGVGILKRPAIDPRGGGSGSSGSGSPSPSGGTPSLRHSQVMPIPSGAQSVAIEEIFSYELDEEITEIDEEMDWIEDGALAMIEEDDQESMDFMPFDPIIAWEGQFAAALP